MSAVLSRSHSLMNKIVFKIKVTSFVNDFLKIDYCNVFKTIYNFTRQYYALKYQKKERQFFNH